MAIDTAPPATTVLIDAGGAVQPITFWRYLFDSLVVSTLVIVGQVFFSAMAAYAFARLEWKHREKWFGFFLGGLFKVAR
ncbi:hypothetical protein AB0368_29120 [Actinoplanes sp. NPDC051475]|uniref:hypothetical protein n=1 Tax=Actinoplanes sp. NPDC051475 TaxID=3157225 RepID=UPI00344C5742